MKTEFLKGLGLEQAAIDAIMAENGKDINVEKEKYKTLEGQLTDVRTKLKAFEGVDVGDLQKKVADLTADLSAKDAEHQKQIAAIEFSRLLEGTVTGAKAKSTKAVMALLDVDKLRDSKNQVADIAAAIDAVKKEHGYLFDGAAAASAAIGPTGGPKDQPAAGQGNTAAANQALRSLFGKGE